MQSEAGVFDLTTRLIYTIREPYRTHIRLLRAGQPLRLTRERSPIQNGQAVRVDTPEGCTVGYLGADTASYLSILLDHGVVPADRSFAENILLAAPSDDPAARRLRYPKLDLHICLDLPDTWPMIVIVAVLGLKKEDFASRFNLPGNPWLKAVEPYRAAYRSQGHDHFHLPVEMAAAWRQLTLDHDRMRRQP